MTQSNILSSVDKLASLIDKLQGTPWRYEEIGETLETNARILMNLLEPSHGKHSKLAWQLRNQEARLAGIRIAVGLGSKLLRPPQNAEFLFYLLMPHQNADAIVGDLEEGYKIVHKKFGRRRAIYCYWFQTFISLRPLVCKALKKTLMKPLIGLIGWALAEGLIRHDGWLAALVEMWKKVVGS